MLPFKLKQKNIQLFNAFNSHMSKSKIQKRCLLRVLAIKNEYSMLPIIQAHSILRKKFKENYFHTYHACKINVDVD